MRKNKNIPNRKRIISYPSALILILGFMFALSFPSASVPQGSDPAAAPLGQTSTLLPDGRSLMIGGKEAGGQIASAFIWNPANQTRTAIQDKLLYPRAHHTATLLPDGTILILGGFDRQGFVVTRPELFNIEKQRFETLTHTALTPRADHTATVLTDGSLLIVGGLSEKGETSESAEIWNPKSNQIQRLAAKPVIPRSRQTAELLPDGTVLLQGGVDRLGKGVTNSEVFDPISQQFVLADAPPSAPVPDVQPPYLEASLPKDGETNVAADKLIALRFSESLQVTTANTGTVTLADKDGSLPVNIVPAEEGMLIFITPKKPLSAGESYTLTVSGPTDLAGLALPKMELRFTVANDAASSNDDEVWDAKELGNWKTKHPESTWTSLPPLQAAPGVTALSGQVLTVNGKPLPNVTLQIGNKIAQSDSSGRFLIQNLPPGPKVLVMDGKTASKPGKTYGLFEIGVDVLDGRTVTLPYTIWMPVIDTAHAVTIPSPTNSEIQVTTPRIPGLKLIIPPQTVIRGRDGEVVRSISITPIPIDRPPFPLPPGVEFPVFFTIQPGGAHVETLSGDTPHGIRVVYPNYKKLPAGQRVQFWNYEPDGTGWFQYGQGTTQPSGEEVIPDLGVAIYKFTMSSFTHFGGGVAYAAGPPAGNPGGTDGDPVDLSTGLFVLSKPDLVLPDVLPITLTRTYRPQDSASRAFGIGATHPYQMFLTGDTIPYAFADLFLPDGGKIHYVRITPGTSHLDAILEHTTTPTIYYKSRLTWNGNGWNLTLKDGTILVFGNANPLQEIRDRYGNKITITRSNGQLGTITRVTSPNRYIDFTYDTSNRITQLKDNAGRTVTYTYDASGRLETVTDPNNGVTQYTYDASHRMLTLKDARGIVFLTNTYDANGRVIQQTQADTTNYHFDYTLDANGKVTQTDVTDPRGKVRRVTFSATGYTLTDIRALGQPEQQVTTYEREAGTNFILSMTDPLNRKTKYTYDALGNRTSITRLFETSEAVTTTFTYEPSFNRVASITDPLNHTTTYAYDSKGSLASVTDPLTHQTTLTYNLAGQPTSIKNPLNHTTQLIYESGDLTSVTDPMGNTTSRVYDSTGHLLALTDPLGRNMTYEYDPLNRVTKIYDPLQGMTALSYDPNGNLLTVTDARNNVTTYTYNSMDRLETRQDPLLLTESYLYDFEGNLATLTDRKSQPISFTYDALNRRKVATYADGAMVTYTYDAGNRIAGIVDSLFGTITRVYDNLNRLTSETTAQGMVSYTYDSASRKQSMTVTGQPTVDYAYDDANRLTQITQGPSTVIIAYDNAGRRINMTLPNGVIVEYTYDAASRISAIDYKQGSTLLGNLTYQYDANGNRIQAGGSWARTGLPQTLSSATYNADNRMITFGDQTLTYDTNGNLISDGNSNFNWDMRNRLISVEGTRTTSDYQYDPLGRRVTKTINGNSTSFLYDGKTALQELSGTIPTANLLPGFGVDEYLGRTDSAGARVFLPDGLGSTLALLNQAGAIQTQYVYEPFGRTSIIGENNSNAFQYTGRENDGMDRYYYRARYYASSLQRFISEDPIEFDGGINLYSYVYNNPLRFVDSSGTLAAPFQPLLNGNFRSGSDAQDGVCSLPQPLGRFADSSPCILKCCQVHDSCYADNKCNDSSWAGNFGVYAGLDLTCQRCNSTALKCALGILWKRCGC